MMDFDSGKYTLLGPLIKQKGEGPVAVRSVGRCCECPVLYATGINFFFAISSFLLSDDDCPRRFVRAKTKRGREKMNSI